MKKEKYTPLLQELENNSDTQINPISSLEITQTKTPIKTKRLNTSYQKSINVEEDEEYEFPSSLPNQIFFSWATRILQISSRQQLNYSDLGKFSPETSPNTLFEKIYPIFKNLQKSDKANFLFKTLLKTNLFPIIIIFLLSIICAYLDTALVIIFRQVLLHFDTEYDEEPYWSLLDTCIIFLIDKIAYIFFYRYFEFFVSKISSEITIQINVILYRKILKISPYLSFSSGELADFVSIDSEKFAEFFTLTPATMVLPFQIAFYIFLLFNYFGPSFLIGIFISIIIVFLSSYLQSKRNSYQKLLLKLKDKRMKLISLSLEKIKVIKAYSWEDYFLMRIKEVRIEEMKILKKIQIITLIVNSLFWSTGMIVSVLSILIHTINNKELEIANILTSIYIFNNLGEPLFLFPDYLNGFLESLISLNRLENFLNQKNLEKIQNKNEINESDSAIFIDKLNFGVIIKKNNFDFLVIDEIIEEDNENDSEEIDEEENDHNADSDYSNKSFDEAVKQNYISFKNKRSGEIKRNSEEIKRNSGEIKRTMTAKDFESKKPRKFLLDIDSEIIENPIDEDVYEDQNYEAITLLKNISINIKKGELIGIIGETGSGKTCLLNAILNNLEIFENTNNPFLFEENNNNLYINKFKINGSISYVSQEPWILNDTIRNNILFFQKYENAKYNQILDICQLKKDLKHFPGEDLQELGEKGINLSGGQKARISLARALYSNNDIYIFDDILSNLDNIVATEIFKHCIEEYLKNKTVIFVTNNYNFLKYMNRIIYMKNGEIIYFGSYENIVKLDYYKNLVNTKEEKKDEYFINEKKRIKQMNLENQKIINKKENLTKVIEKNKNSNIKEDNKEIKFHKLTKNETYIKDDDVKLYKIVFSYTGGLYYFFLILIVNVFWKSCEFFCDYFITQWSITENLTHSQNLVYLIIYLFFGVLTLILIFSKTFIIVNGLLKFYKRIHKSLVKKIFFAPINLFHDVIPKSQILNRLTRDLDNSIKFFWGFNTCIRLSFNLFFCFFAAIFLNYYSIFVLPFLIYIYIWIYNFYNNCFKDLCFLENISRQKIISSFSETISGIQVIRAYNSQLKFQNRFYKRLNNFYKINVYLAGISGWFALNLDICNFSFLFLVLIFSIIFQNYTTPDTIGLLLSYSLKLIQFTYSFFDQYNNLSKYLNSVKRCDAFTKIIQEKKFYKKKDVILKQENFPKNGKIEFINFNVKYRPDLKTVLKNLNFVIQPSEKIGIVGKSGSGKSTIALCIFRILEALNGKILIDDVDISKIGLKYLRENITVIPQDPTLIEGSLRDNLDPYYLKTDEEIINLMKEIGIEYLINKNGGLEFNKLNDMNLSLGERQLICIARAILRKSKIYILDEATSSVDDNTEQLIQKVLKKFLKDCTVLTIAHRINTILNYDRIFVLEKGELIETGTPKELINKGKGIFYELYSQSLE